MPAADNETLVRAFLGRMGPTAQDVRDAVDEFLTDDCVWENPGSPACHGRDAVHDLMPDDLAQLVVRFRHVASAGDTVLVERVEDLLRTDGTPIARNLAVAAAFEVRDGRISAWRDYFDVTALITPDPDAPEEDRR